MVFNFRNALENYDGDIEMLRSLVLGYVERIPSDLSQIDDRLDAGDLAEVAMRAHALKGGSGYVGADGILTAASELEIASHNGDIEHARELAVQLREEFDKYLHAISAHDWGQSETPD